jgi:predicted  nucleic acid-binding Zn-ribbon protein
VRSFLELSPAPAPLPTAALTFKFASIAKAETSPARLDASAPKLPTSFFSSKPSSLGSSSPNEDVLRLRGVVDDLTSRMRKLSDAKVAVDAQAHKLNTALANERTANSTRVSALKGEIATLTENENKLRVALAARPKETVKPNQFANRVRTALEVDEINSKYADAEANMLALEKKKASLTSEVSILSSRKETILEETKSALTRQEVEELVATAAEATDTNARLADEKSALENEVETLTTLRNTRREETTAAEIALASANATTTTAAADASAAKQQLFSMQTQLDSASKTLESTNAQLATASKTMASRHVFKVTGASAPARSQRRAKLVEFACCASRHVPNHLSLDAPADIGMQFVTAHTEASNPDATNGPTQKMVDALIGDLKTSFMNTVQFRCALNAPLVAATGEDVA